MAETNFYSYMYAQASAVAFDELAEVVELNNPESVQRAFESYLSDYTPPLDIKEALMEEKFYSSSGEGDDGEQTYVRYDMSIPGIEENIDVDGLKAYFEDFLDKIDAKNDSHNIANVEVELLDDERGGKDVSIYIAIGGEQTQNNSKS